MIPMVLWAFTAYRLQLQGYVKEFHEMYVDFGTPVPAILAVYIRA
jgi:hypothetical protein